MRAARDLYLKSGDRGDGGHDGRSVVGHVHLEGGAHLGVRVVGGGVPDHCDVITELGGEPNRRLDARMRDQTHDDDPLDPMAFELQVQVGVGETAGTSML